MSIITATSLRNQLRTTIPSRTPQKVSEIYRLGNLDSFNSLDRTGLNAGRMQNRLLLYQSKSNEKIYIQYPGKESLRTGVRAYPLDFRPILKKADGSLMDNMDFNAIWDKIDVIGKRHSAHLDILGILFLRMAYMIEYNPVEGDYLLETINIRSNRAIASDLIPFAWNRLSLSDDVIDTLNDHFDNIGDISFEGFLYYNDLLAQNEDCKYSYRSRMKGNVWNQKTGRINTFLTHLSIIAHLRDNLGISALMNRFQRGNGVAPIPQQDFVDACGNLIERI